MLDRDGKLVERYEYTPYGERKVFVSAGANDPGCYAPTTISGRRTMYTWTGQWNSVPVSVPDQPFGLCEFGHQGLLHEEELDNGNRIQNRNRVLHAGLGRFIQRDPLGYVDGMSLYQYIKSNPLNGMDMYGLSFWSNAGAFAKGVGKGLLGVAVGAAVVTAVIITAPVVLPAAAATAVSIGVMTAAAAAGGYVTGKAVYEAGSGNAVDWKGQPTGNKLSTEQRLERAGEATVGVAAIGLAAKTALKGNPSTSNNAIGAGKASSEASNSGTERIYGPPNDPKINADGSTNPKTWTTPDGYSTSMDALNKLDPWKYPSGYREAAIPEGTLVQRGVTPGNEGPWGASGSGNETLIPDGLPPGSVGPWRPIVPYLPPTILPSTTSNSPDNNNSSCSKQ